jgi:RNA polymerase sigma factor (sigma-70 family)
MSIFRNDPDLLKPFREGDRAALERVYRHYARDIGLVLQQGLRKFAFAYGHELRSNVVADLTQDTFIKAFSEKGRLGFDGLRDYGPYIATIARNLLTDWLRRNGREESLKRPEDISSVEVDEPAPWEDMRTVELVERYLAALDEPLRSVHRLHYGEGRGQEAVADALGLSRQNVRTLLERLREGLRKRLVDDDASRPPTPTKNQAAQSTNLRSSA